MNGLLVIDKPLGLTSHQVVQEIRHLVPSVKIGHAGTLDPAATGVLPLCLGKATRIVEYVMDLPKGYRAEVVLGATTETGDAQGKIRKGLPVPPLSREQVEAVFAGLTGELAQVPPAYSAIKYRGKPMYYWARRGIKVELPPRMVHIYRLELLAFNYPGRPHLILEAECSRGTYMRTLAEQIGERLGTGAYLCSLQRNFVGPFTREGAITLKEAQELARSSGLQGVLLPLDRALQHLPAMTLEKGRVERLQQGRSLPREQCVGPPGEAIPWEKGRRYRVYNRAGSFKTLAVVEDVAGELQLKPEKNF